MHHNEPVIDLTSDYEDAIATANGAASSTGGQTGGGGCGGGGGGGGAAACCHPRPSRAAARVACKKLAAMDNATSDKEEEEDDDDGWGTNVAAARAVPESGYWYKLDNGDGTRGECVGFVKYAVDAGERVLFMLTSAGNELLVPWTPRVRFETHSRCSPPAYLRTYPPAWDPTRRWTGSCPFLTGSDVCGAKVDTWPFCAAHLQEAYKVQVRPSSVADAGFGLFTTEKITVPKGESRMLIPFCGELISKRTYDNRYPQGQSTYVVACQSGQWYLDAMVRRGVGAMVNCSSSAKSSASSSTSSLASSSASSSSASSSSASSAASSSSASSAASSSSASSAASSSSASSKSLVNRANRANAYFVYRTMREQFTSSMYPAEYCFVWLEVRKTIARGAELFVDYNDRSWKRRMQACGTGANKQSAVLIGP